MKYFLRKKKFTGVLQLLFFALISLPNEAMPLGLSDLEDFFDNLFSSEPEDSYSPNNTPAEQKTVKERPQEEREKNPNSQAKIIEPPDPELLKKFDHQIDSLLLPLGTLIRRVRFNHIVLGGSLYERIKTYGSELSDLESMVLQVGSLRPVLKNNDLEEVIKILQRQSFTITHIARTLLGSSEQQPRRTLNEEDSFILGTRASKKHLPMAQKPIIQSFTELHQAAQPLRKELKSKISALAPKETNNKEPEQPRTRGTERTLSTAPHYPSSGYGSYNYHNTPRENSYSDFEGNYRQGSSGLSSFQTPSSPVRQSESSQAVSTQSQPVSTGGSNINPSMLKQLQSGLNKNNPDTKKIKSTKGPFEKLIEMLQKLSSHAPYSKESFSLEAQTAFKLLQDKPKLLAELEELFNKKIKETPSSTGTNNSLHELVRGLFFTLRAPTQQLIASGESNNEDIPLFILPNTLKETIAGHSYHKPLPIAALQEEHKKIVLTRNNIKKIFSNLSKEHPSISHAVSRAEKHHTSGAKRILASQKRSVKHLLRRYKNATKEQVPSLLNQLIQLAYQFRYKDTHLYTSQAHFFVENKINVDSPLPPSTREEIFNELESNKWAIEHEKNLVEKVKAAWSQSIPTSAQTIDLPATPLKSLPEASSSDESNQPGTHSEGKEDEAAMLQELMKLLSSAQNENKEVSQDT
jgi:hypothetical protein